ncbi:MAG: tRNA 4-thiouridine(8) synthase ThiI [Candidatus Binatia bacterium]|nr:tRNA 4-thiouridine(8) synthase ThiI [Candidatus Binatia bacterium]
MQRVVVHYHEIALKQRNRPLFVRQLLRNIEGMLRDTPCSRVRSAEGRVVIDLLDASAWPTVRERLGWVFGIANFALAWKSGREVEALAETALTALGNVPAQTFAVRVKRADKSYPLPSPEIARQVGRLLQERLHWAVDLEQPQVEVFIEVLAREAFVSVERVRGLGGLPVGVSGPVICLLSGGIDSPVAAWRMMGRGCRVEFVHFSGTPYQDRRSLEKAQALARILTRYQLQSRLHAVAFGEIQRQIVASVARPYRVVLYRRMMLRIAAALAGRVHAKALVTGESLGQVASQTLENLATIERAVDLMVLRPLIGMDKNEIRAQAERIGTYEISIQPDQDCCQLFVPPLPATRTSPAEAERAEQALDVAALVAEALERVETFEYSFP